MSFGNLCTFAKCSRSRTFLSYSARLAYILPTIEATFPNIVACISAENVIFASVLLLNIPTSDKHDDDREYFLLPSIACNITKPNSSQGGGREIHGGHVSINLVYCIWLCWILILSLSTWDMKDLCGSLYRIASCSSQPAKQNNLLIYQTRERENPPQSEWSMVDA